MISNLIAQNFYTARQRFDKYRRLFLPPLAEVRLFLWPLVVAILLTIYYFLDVSKYLLNKKFFLDKDIAHINAQFFLATIVGGIVAIGYRNWENRRAAERQAQDKEREARQQAQEKEREIRGLNRAALVEFYRSTNDLQNEFKKIKRCLRAASFVDEAGERWIERGDFECLMEKFEDCQLRAESLYRQAKARRELFGFGGVREPDGDEDPSLETNSEDPGTLVRLNLCKTKKYLRKAVRPYERNFHERRALTRKELLAITDGALKGVIDPPHTNPNSKPVPDPMDTVRTHLLRMISNSSPH
jgi:hypothetical protein